MIDLERQKENFKNHVVKFTDHGNIKIVDFKAPDTSHYRIRFLFEEDYCRLHISGDLGELSATNYNNMTFGKFSDFVNNTGYFEEKIDCLSRQIYVYDEDKARKDLKKLIEEYDLEEEFKGDWNDTLDDAINEVLEDFSDTTGIGSKGYDVASDHISDFFEDAKYIGREETGILELYMLAFKLAMEQLNSNLN